ncbi:hypothetical protein ACI3KS_05080 [Microbacterium sp. ZW T5_45]|uniref:hypothetical protein n=1 Tax=Microbacterium sp. ZW T5_45 TaxID=3378080 RepID=UPI00385380E5
MSYKNGEIPLDKLVHLGANHYLPPGTAARWLWFVAEGQKRFGVTFRITPDRDGLGGWNAYRPRAAQAAYKKALGSRAAAVGYSTHGGVVGGAVVFAIDVDNWQAVPWANFRDLANEAGFRTDFVSPSERWHIGDFNDGWVIPAFTQATPVATAPDLSEEDDMQLIRWNGQHVFGIGREAVCHVPNPATLALLEKVHGKAKDVGNDGLTAELNFAGVHWDAVDAVLNGTGPLSGGKYWSRLAAEGIAIRDTQAAQSKTIADVLATAKGIESATA